VALSCSGATGTKPVTGAGYDVIVYGGTAAGAVAAISAAQEGLKVAVLEPEQHVGGMVSGGLGATDVGNGTVIGGLALEFFRRVGSQYGVAGPVWSFEPHVAENIFRSLLDAAGVEVFFSQRLASVHKTGPRIDSIRMENGREFQGKVFIDATYEGDMLPKAGVSYTWGRESRATYGESLAGRRVVAPLRWFDVRVDGLDEGGSLLPLLQANDGENAGDGDRKVQAYNFRLCLTNRADNRVPFARPPDYDPKRYEIFRRYLVAASRGGTVPLRFGHLVGSASLANGKTDTNNTGSMSTDFIGGSWGYPDADYRQRGDIRAAHKSYLQGLLYFLANDPALPAELRDDAGQWGLARDEFVDTENWPHQLYVREARRMLGGYVMTQSDLQDARQKEDSIGMGSYNIDSHGVQRLFDPARGVVTEGEMEVPVSPYDIPYRAIIPKASECENLLVPVCLSASHVAYASLRMEPQYMITGHAAGQAAFLAVRDGVRVQGIAVGELQERLRTQGQVLTLGDYAPPTGSITINGGAATTYSTSVSLTLAAEDNIGVASMQFSKDDGASWTPWEAYAPTRSVTLVKGYGDNAILVRFMDATGNISAEYGAAIRLLPPPLFTCTITINDGAATARSRSVKLTLAATDEVGVTDMQFSKDGTAWYPWEPFTTVRIATLDGSPGPNTIYVRFRDAAGNVSGIYSGTITLLP
jgi:hypothetical protein